MDTALISSSHLNKLTINNIETAFQQLLDSQDYSINSKKALLRDWLSFVSFQEAQYSEPFNPKKVLEGDIADYKRHLIQADKKPATINRQLSSLRILFRLLKEQGYIPLNPVLKVKPVPKPPLKPKSLSELEVKRFRREVRAKGNLKHAAITDLMLFAGLRCSEVAALRVNDLSLSERKGHIEVRYGKGLKSRSVPLCSEAREVLSAYLSHIQPKEYLFVSDRGASRGSPLTIVGINKIVKQYAERAGIKASPHTLRHTMATQYLRQPQANLIALQQILGHSDLRTTSIYCQNSLEDLQANVEGLSY